MIITNKSNLPQAIYNVIAHDGYKRGKSGYSVTEVINSPRIVQLSRKYRDMIEEDAMQRIWSVFGSAVHHLMETHASEDGFSEERYYITVLDRVIGGQIDAYESKTITDYKVTSVWSLMGNKKEDWEKQQNLYAYIMRKNGIEVEKIQIACFLRDWSKGNAKRGGDYPQQPFMIVPLRMWSEEETEAYLYERVQALIDNERVVEYQCSSTDMWEKPTIYAVTKAGATKATKLCSSKQEASDYILDKCPDNWDKNGHSKDLYNAIVRKGERTRCSDYCSVNSVCSIYQNYLKEGAI